MKRRAFIFLFALLLLSGCGKSEIPPTETAGPEIPVPAEVPEETPPPDPIAVRADAYSPELGRYPLLDTDEVQAELVFTKAPDSGVVILLHATNRGEKDLRLCATDLLLNGNVQVNDTAYLDLPAAGETFNSHFPSFKTSCAMLGYENVRELSLTLKIDGNGRESAVTPCTVVFPEGICLTHAYESFRDARADRQVLLADARVTAALLCCGHFYADGGFERLIGVLWIENHGDETIPVALSGLSVNGTSVPFYASDCSLQPGESCLIEFNASANDFDLAGIRSISSLRLQLLTSEEENSAGARGAEGGNWYPVALARSGAVEEEEEAGELLYDDGMLLLRLVDASLSEISDGNVRADYTLLVVNRRREGISLYLSEPMSGGEAYVDPYSGKSVLFHKNDQIGPESRGYMSIRAFFPAEKTAEAVPEISFLLQVRSQGGDSIFYSVADRITLFQHKEEQP